MKRELVASAFGTVAVAALAPIERAVLGRPPRFAPAKLAARLARKQLGVRLSEAAARRVGLGMRAAYGPSWGFALAAFPRAFKRRPLLAGLVLGLLVDAFEERAFRLSDATPDPAGWPSTERVLLRVQTLAYGLTATFAHLRLSRRARA